MTKQELEQLSRNELAEILLEITQENEQLRAELEQARAKLDERTIDLVDSGDMTQAFQMVTEILEKTQAEAKQYIENIRLREAAVQRSCARMEKNARLICQRKKQEAQAQVDAYLKQIDARLREGSESYLWKEMSAEDSDSSGKSE